MQKTISPRELIVFFYLFLPLSLVSQNQWIEFKDSDIKSDAYIVHNFSDVNPFKYVLQNSTDTLELLAKDVEKFCYKKRKKGDIIFYSFLTKENGFQFFQKKINNQLIVVENYKTKELFLIINEELIKLESDQLDEDVLSRILPRKFRLINKSISSNFENLQTLDLLIQNNISRYPGFHVGIFGSIYSNDLHYGYSAVNELIEDSSNFPNFKNDQTFNIENLDVGIFSEFSIIPSVELGITAKAYFSRQDIKNVNFQPNFTTSINGQVNYFGGEFGFQKHFSQKKLFPFIDFGIGYKVKLDSNLDFADYNVNESNTTLTIRSRDIMPNYISLSYAIGLEIPYSQENYIFARVSIDHFFSSFDTSTVIPKLTLGLNIL